MTATTRYIRATIEERGNGFAGLGEYVAGDDGEVYRVVTLLRHGHIETHGPGAPNTIEAEVELADWDDVTDETEPYCSAVIDALDGDEASA